ncbi:MAG: LapA family protein [Acidocella sp.]|nr:LapA family protein [Acidocella sp.]
MKLIKTFIGFVVILGLVIFLLSNRQAVDIGFWPFGFLVALPLGAIVLAVLAVGFLLGLLFHAPTRFAAGRRAKRAEGKVAALEARLNIPPSVPTKSL